MAQLAKLALYPSDMLAVVDSVPICVKATTVEAIGQSNCQGDVTCLCRDDVFLTTLVKAILRKCKPSDQDVTLHLAQDYCGRIVPSLNDNRKKEIIVILVVMMIASTFAVALRVAARRISASKYGLDDLFILIALIFAHGMNAIEFVALTQGYGRHQLMLSFHQMKSFLLHDWAAQIIFSFSITASRLSLLVFYYRVFPVQRFRTVTIIIACVCIGWLISFLFAVIFNCVPVQAFWDRSIDGKCIDENSFAYGITTSELVANLAMLTLPVPWLWSLNLPRSKKFALGGIFLMGSFVCLTCVVRFPLLTRFRQTDASWTIVPTGLWTAIECHIGITSVCLPIMRPIFLNRAPHPVRSRFSAFSFSISRPSVRDSMRLAEEETPSTQNLSGKTLTTFIPSLPGRYGRKSRHDRSASRDPITSNDDETSLNWQEPWGQNIGAANRSDPLQPWGQNIGALDGRQGWELDIMPPSTCTAGTGPQTDGRVERWARF
ncbi:hypothetical protein MMC29_002964 [Sticta canariensis]|nr:hypothetical protein [Sticta canariensis]